MQTTLLERFMSPLLKRGLHWGGSVLAILGVAFVIIRLHHDSAQINIGRLTTSHWLVLLGLALGYATANGLLALAWRNLLEHLGSVGTRRWAIRVYGLSQIAKYLPGNVFHIAGRQALGMADGVPGWPLAKSAAWELGLIAATGGLFGWLAVSLLMPGVSMPAGIGLWALTLAGAAWLLVRFGSPSLARAFGLQAAFLVFSGAVFVGLVELVGESSSLGIALWPVVAGAYILAWLAGLVTPGAPAGVGVREMVLLFLLQGLVSNADLLLAVLLGRLVTVLGDVLFFAATFLVPKLTQTPIPGPS